MNGRTGLVRISSMCAVCTPREVTDPGHSDAPWITHWSRNCSHEARPRLKKYESGLVRAKLQCIKCGQGIGGNIPMKGVCEPWDEELESQVTEEYAIARQEYERRRSDNSDITSGVWWKLYNQYLNSAVWAVKRELVLERAGGICEACGQEEAEQVHHIPPYPKTFGLEPLWTLRAVCHSCHEIIHDREIQRRPR